LVEDDDRLLFDIGLIVGEDSTNRFVLSDNDDQFEESDQAECFVRVYHYYPLKIYKIVVEKNDTAGDFYKQVLQTCHDNDLNTDSFDLTFNHHENTNEMVRVFNYINYDYYLYNL